MLARLGVLLATAITVLSLGPVPAHADTPPAPPVGACYDYGYAAFGAVSNSSPAVPCNSRHTALTVAVGTLADGTTWDTLGSTANQELVGTDCFPEKRQAVGGTWSQYNQSAYVVSWFVPTKAEFDAGARWFRCDVVLPGATQLFALRSKTPLLGRLTDTNRRCLDKDGVGYSCRSPHVYRAAGTFAVPQRRYPARAKAVALAERHCPVITKTKRWWWMSPGKAFWKSGDRQITCYAGTKR